MTRTEKKLHLGAEYWWPGSGDDLVLVYRAYAADRQMSLWAAVTLASLLRQPEERRGCLAELRKGLPTSTRLGPKQGRIKAALAALDHLDAALEGA